MSQNDDIIIGIDLGTTFSCVSALIDGKITIFSDEFGQQTVPSYVSFTPHDILVGRPAKANATLAPEQTVFDSKRMIGRIFADASLQQDLKHWPFRVVGDAQGLPTITCQTINVESGQYTPTVFRPEQISAFILSQLKKIAEQNLGISSVTKAVITVPAYFTDAQRTGTLAAAKIAGLDVQRLLNEPTAAAIAYGITQERDNGLPRRILVFDLGGGTFDVSILQIQGNSFRVLATSGDAHLGGEDFDNIIVVWLKRQFEVTYGKDVAATVFAQPTVLRRFKTIAEEIKIALSSSSSYQVDVPNIAPDDALFEVEMTRARFEQLCQKAFKKVIAPLEDALTQAKLTKNAIDDVVLIGGSSRVPAIRRLVADFFDGKELSQAINPDEAVSIGAAVQAAILSSNPRQKSTNSVHLTDVTPSNLGITTAAEKVSVILPRNSPIPASNKKRYTTSVDNQDTFIIEVVEGNDDEKNPQNYTIVGTVYLNGITPLPAGSVIIAVTFHFDENGVLTCSAEQQKRNTDGSISTETNLPSLHCNFPKRHDIAPIDLILMRADMHEMAQDEDHLAKLRAMLKDTNPENAEFRALLAYYFGLLKDASAMGLNQDEANRIIAKVKPLLEDIASGKRVLDSAAIDRLRADLNREMDKFLAELRAEQRKRGLLNANNNASAIQ